MQTPRLSEGSAPLYLWAVTFGEPRGEAPVRRAEPGFELALERCALAGHDQFELPRLVATVPVHLVAVQRLAALAARCEGWPRFVHVHLFENVCAIFLFRNDTCNVLHKDG
jgi:hypothetical protein